MPLLIALGSPGGLGAAPDPAEAWWEGGWTGRMKVKLSPPEAFPESGLPDSGIGPVAVLVRLHGGNFPFGAARSDGADLRFVSADHATEYPFHIESYDDLLQEAFLWVRLPEVATGETSQFWLYHGNPTPPANPPDSAQSYAQDTLLVYHFGDRWNAQVLPEGVCPADASGNKHHGTTPGRPVESALIGGGLRVNPEVSVQIPGDASLVWEAGAPLSLSVWVTPETLAPRASILFRENGSARFDLGLDGGSPYLELVSAPGSFPRKLVAEESIAPGTWCHLAVVADAASVTLWCNGVPVGSLDGPLPALDGPVELASPRATGQFSGQIDELQLARTAWSGSHIRFLHANQGPGLASTRLVSLEPDAVHEAKSTGVNYMSVILDTLTWDGWTIISILLVMSAISWMVILFKARHLNAVEHANHQFVRVWNRVADNLGALETDEGMEALGHQTKHPVQARTIHHSPLFHLYRTGWEQVALRTRGLPKDAVNLSGLAVQSVRAAMYASCIRETDKLNSGLSFLTIAISGAPFLGLLGTVLGVTVTFASIAAAGEVNVNTIAPGIAAALTTTIVGLCVAIPALFGYNYLLAPIKRMNTQMRIFVDEFITRTAEVYADHHLAVTPVLASGSGVAAPPAVVAPPPAAVPRDRGTAPPPAPRPGPSLSTN